MSSSFTTLNTSADKVDVSFDGLLSTVLNEQQDLSAVERFAQWHDRTASEHNDALASQTPTFAKHYTSLMPATVPGTGQQYAFEVDLDACSGCKACVVACHNLNGLESDEAWRKVGWLTSHDRALPIVQHVTTACHHCVDPGCLSGCPVKAYEKDPLTGIVRHLDDQCFGCKYCTMMCPYEVPQYSATLGIVRKCDMCSQRIGNNEAPACVQACPNEAIRITLVESMKVRELGNSSTTTLLPTAPPSHITLPTTNYLSARDHKTCNLVSHEAVIDHPHEGHWPLVGMLVLTQASVGMWCVLSFLVWNDASPSNEYLGTAIIASTLGIVGVHLALAHLGRPWLAFRAFLGWRTSWLSREAIAFGVYMAVAVTLATAM
jgi:formate dehydrogenase iron-sulfur subunit